MLPDDWPPLLEVVVIVGFDCLAVASASLATDGLPLEAIPVDGSAVVRLSPAMLPHRMRGRGAGLTLSVVGRAPAAVADPCRQAPVAATVRAFMEL